MSTETACSNTIDKSWRAAHTNASMMVARAAAGLASTLRAIEIADRIDRTCFELTAAEIRATGLWAPLLAALASKVRQLGSDESALGALTQEEVALSLCAINASCQDLTRSFPGQDAALTNDRIALTQIHQPTRSKLAKLWLDKDTWSMRQPLNILPILPTVATEPSFAKSSVLDRVMEWKVDSLRTGLRTALSVLQQPSEVLEAVESVMDSMSVVGFGAAVCPALETRELEQLITNNDADPQGLLGAPVYRLGEVLQEWKMANPDIRDDVTQLITARDTLNDVFSKGRDGKPD